MRKWISEVLGIGALAAWLSVGAGCGPVFQVVDEKTPAGQSARRVIRIVESVEGRGSTNVVIASETDEQQAPYAPLLDAIAILSPLTCTVTHLGRGVVITAGHCFEEKPPDNKPSYVRKLDDDRCIARIDGFDSPVRMQWGYRYGHPPYLASACARIVAREWTDDRDFAVMIIAPTDGKLPSAAIEPDFADPAAGSGITMFSHPDPALRWSGFCKLGVPDGASLPYFLHRCTTRPGSSGAAVIDTTTHKIVGIHLGEQDVLAPGATASQRPPENSGTNYAISLSDPVIFSHIRRAFAQVAVREETGRLPPPVQATATN